ncbi:MAG: sel1 repeat family protein [Thermoguttaceae bacterium]|nr:sel1 repeat family protein [Thermoguttaceae bacterium]
MKRLSDYKTEKEMIDALYEICPEDMTARAIEYDNDGRWRKSREWHVKAAEAGCPESMTELIEYDDEEDEEDEDDMLGLIERFAFETDEEEGDEEAIADLADKSDEEKMAFLKSRLQIDDEDEEEDEEYDEDDDEEDEDELDEESMKWLRKFKEVADGPALYNFTEEELAEDKRIEWYLLAAERGSAAAEGEIVYAYAEGASGAKKDEAEAEKWLAKMEETKNGEGFWQLGLCYDVGDARVDPQKALEYYVKSAELGYGEAIAKLVVRYLRGEKGTPKDAAEAEKWFRKLDESGDQGGLRALALRLDEEEGRDWLLRTAEAGSAYAMEQLILDNKDVEKWTERLVKTGRNREMEELAEFYDDHKRPEEALFWYLKASENGNRWATRKLAIWRIIGKNVEKNLDEAERLRQILIDTAKDVRKQWYSK